MSAAATIGSIITYLQALGITLDLDIDLPQWMQSFFNYFSDIFHFFNRYIDSRFALLLLMVVIPGFVDFFANLVAEKPLYIFLHFVDLGIITSVILTTAFITYNSVNMQIATGSCFLYLFIRFVFLLVQKKKHKKEKIEIIIKDIVDHYMAKINPNSLENQIISLGKYHEYLVQLNVKQKPFQKSTVCFLVFFDGILAILIGVLYLGVGVNSVSSTVLAFLLFIMFTVLYCMESGRSAFHKISIFIKHWGLRLIFFIIEIIYIPISRFILRFYIPYRYSCGYGKYFASPGNINGFVSANLFDPGCYTCGQPLNATSGCAYLCDGHFEMRIRTDLSIKYSDISKSFVFCLVYGTLMIVIGVPLLWSVYIRKNKKLLRMIPIYGNTLEQKWEHLVMLFKTNGIFFFDCYNMKNSYWTIWYFFMRFLITTAIELSQSVNKFILILLTLTYFGQVLVLFWRRPYLSKFNTIVDIIFFAANSIFTLLPLLSLCGVKIGNSTSISVFALVIAIPSAVPIIVRFFNNQSLKRGNKSVKRIFYEDGNEDDDRFESELKTRAKYRFDVPKSVSSQWQRQLYPESSDQTIDIVEAKITSIDKIVNNPTMINEQKVLYTTSRQRSIKKLRKMYDLLDRIIDNYTISEIAVVMRCTVDLGFIMLMNYSMYCIIGNSSKFDVDPFMCS